MTEDRGHYYQTYTKPRYERRKKMLADLKAEEGCTICGFKDHRALVFHHRDESTKYREISKLILRSIDTLEAEIAKCDVLCQNCHHILEYEKAQPILDLHERSSGSN